MYLIAYTRQKKKTYFVTNEIVPAYNDVRC